METNPPTADVSFFTKPGHTLISELIDAHIYADQGRGLALGQLARFCVTTVLDMANGVKAIQDLRIMAKERSDVADIKSACTGAMADGGRPAPVILAHDQSPGVNFREAHIFLQSFTDRV